MSITNITAANDGWVRGDGASYSDARNSAVGGASGATVVAVGQTTTPGVLRGFLSFTIPSVAACAAASLFIKGFQDISTADFAVYILDSDYTPPLSVGDFPEIDGWAASGVYTGTVLNNSWNSADYPGDGSWWEITLNAAARAKIVAATDSTLRLALVSKEDYDESAPVAAEWMQFYSSSTAGSEPYLRINYTPPIVYEVAVGGELEFSGATAEVCEFPISIGGELDLEGVLTGGNMDWIEIHPWQNWSGEWDAAVEYALYDVVLYQDGGFIHAFVSKAGHNTGNLPTDPVYWDRLVQTKWRL